MDGGGPEGLGVAPDLGLLVCEEGEGEGVLEGEGEGSDELPACPPDTVTVLEPLARLPTTTVVTLPLGRTMLPVTFCAVLGPLLVKVTVAVMVLPGVP